MKRVIASALLWTVCCVTAANASETKPLVEVRVSGVGMGTFAGEYLYLRVFADGRVEYEDAKDGGSKFVPRESRLSSLQLRSLKEFLDSSDVRELKSEFPPASPAVDHRTTVKVSINRAGKTQSIEIPNYNLPMGKDQDLYPQALINLMCRIEQARGNTSSRLTAKGWCTIWSK